MEDTYRTCRRLITDIHDQLTAIEKGTDVSAEIQGLVSANINSLARAVGRLDEYLPLEPPNRRELWRKRTAAVRDENESLRGSFEDHVRRVRIRENDMALKEELLRRRGGSGNGEVKRGMLVEADTRDSLSVSHTIMDSVLDAGSDVLHGLKSQRDTLKNAHRKVMDVANVLGISQTVMRLIERRQIGDKWIVYIGIFLTLGVIWAVWKYIL